MKGLISVIFLLTLFSGCGQKNKQMETTSSSDKLAGKEQPQKTTANNLDKFTGVYVSEGYDKRNEGFDWVGILISKWSDSTAFIKVRSRTDQKRATCTYTSFAKLKDANTLSGMYEGSGIVFQIEGDSLKVSSDNPSDETRPAYFCSGGGSLEGTYTKISSGLDKLQMDTLSFSRVLIMDKFIFDVLSTERDAGNTLVVKSVGDKNPNNELRQMYDGIITNAEITDLNNDGFPEILVYVSSADKSRKGTVYGFSSNSGKSISVTGIPQFSSNPEATKGYRGFDEYTVIENKLVQRFPVFPEGSNVPSKMRQIQYVLTDGENARVFKIEKITEY
jgi:hypothetical protein